MRAGSEVESRLFRHGRASRRLTRPQRKKSVDDRDKPDHDIEQSAETIAYSVLC
jgi:hypothetical protein